MTSISPRLQPSKFEGIEYPFFGLKHKPSELIFGLNEIKCIQEGAEYYIENTNLAGNTYLDRLMLMDKYKILRIKYDYTCFDLQDMVNARCKWGIDSKGKVFDLSTLEYCLLKQTRITRFRKNYIWVRNISYPLEIKGTQKIANIENIDEYYVNIVKVNNIWVIYQFTLDRMEGTKILRI